jgi:hypothetical protein
MMDGCCVFIVCKKYYKIVDRVNVKESLKLRFRKVYFIFPPQSPSGFSGMSIIIVY